MLDRYEIVIKKLVTYGQALENKKHIYSCINDSVLNLSEQEQKYDAVFILDYMLETNKKMVVYLRFLQKTNNGLAIKARDSLFESHDDNSNAEIHLLVENIRREIIANSNIIRDALKGLIWKLQVTQFISLSTMVILPGLVLSFLLGWIATIPMTIVAVAAVATGIVGYYLNTTKAEISEIKENILEPISVLKKDNYQTSIPVSRKWAIETIRSNFFSKTIPGSASTISNDITLEYQNLMKIKQQFHTLNKRLVIFLRFSKVVIVPAISSSNKLSLLFATAIIIATRKTFVFLVSFISCEKPFETNQITHKIGRAHV